MRNILGLFVAALLFFSTSGAGAQDAAHLLILKDAGGGSKLVRCYGDPLNQPFLKCDDMGGGGSITPKPYSPNTPMTFDLLAAPSTDDPQLSAILRELGEIKALLGQKKNQIGMMVRTSPEEALIEEVIARSMAGESAIKRCYGGCMAGNAGLEYCTNSCGQLSANKGLRALLSKGGDDDFDSGGSTAGSTAKLTDEQKERINFYDRQIKVITTTWTGPAGVEQAKDWEQRKKECIKNENDCF